MYRTREEMLGQWTRKGVKATKSDYFKKSGATGAINIPAFKDRRYWTQCQAQEAPGS